MILAAKPEPVNCKQLRQCSCFASELLLACQMDVGDHVMLSSGQCFRTQNQAALTPPCLNERKLFAVIKPWQYEWVGTPKL